MKQSIMNIATLLLACIVFNSFTTVNAQSGLTVNSVTIRYASQPRVNQFFTCNVDYTNPSNSNTVNPFYSWTLNDQIFSTGSTKQRIFISADAGAMKGDRIQCSVYLTDTAAGTVSNTVASPYVVFVNTPPTIDVVSITPASPKTASIINCTLAGVSDIDDQFGPFLYNFTWYKNNIPLYGYYTNSLPPRIVERGDTIACSAAAYDYTDWGPITTSATVTVVNSPPRLLNTYVSSTTGSPLTKLLNAVCTIGVTVDDDRNDLNFTYTYAWMINSNVVSSVSGTTLLSRYYVKGDRVSCLVTPHDAFDAGVATQSTFLTVANTPPVAWNVTISPSSPTVTQPITCHPAVTSDVDIADTVFTYQYRWFVNGALIQGLNSAVFPAGRAQKQQIVSCQAAASDGTDLGNYSSIASVTVVNSPPLLSNVSIVSFPDNVNPTEFHCQPGSFTDPDNDAISLISYYWYVNGRLRTITQQYIQQRIASNQSVDALMLQWAQDPFQGYYNQSTLSVWDWGDSIQCSVIARDAESSAPEVFSAVQNITSPFITDFVALDPTNADAIYSDGDQLRITFNVATNRGVTDGIAVLDKSMVDVLLNFSVSLGNDYKAVWTDDQHLLITIIDARDNGKPRIGSLRVHVKSTALLRYRSGNSLLSGYPRSLSPVLHGSFGSAPLAYIWGLTGNTESQSINTPQSVNFTSSTGEAFTTAAVGKQHAFVIGDHIFAFGLNDEGQLGVQADAELVAAFPSYPTYNKLTAFYPIADFANIQVEAVTCGQAHSVVMDSNGEVYLTGRNTNGQLGVNTLQQRNQWRKLIINDTRLDTRDVSQTSRYFTHIAAGYDFTILSRTSGSSTLMFAFGRHFGSFYNPAQDFSTPQFVDGVSQLQVAEISAGSDHVLLLTTNGNVYGFGRNVEGQLGLDSAVKVANQPTHIQALANYHIIHVSAGAFHSLAVTNDSQIICFGKNTEYQCGIRPDLRFIYTPTVIPASSFNHTYASQVSAGHSYSLSVNLDGNAYGFGWNENHALGLSDEYYPNPAIITALLTPTIASVYTQQDISLALSPYKASECISGCSAHGACLEGVCMCTPLWSGDDCSIPVCQLGNGKTCNGNGTCTIVNDAPYCNCNSGFTGTDCTLPDCSGSLQNCNGHGVCSFDALNRPYCQCKLGYASGVCNICELGWSGSDCQILDCSRLNNCNGHGNCTAINRIGQCSCAAGWAGNSCSEPFCLSTSNGVCNSHGVCGKPLNMSEAKYTEEGNLIPVCTCDNRWTGELCQQFTCVGNGVPCSGNGICSNSNGAPTCICNSDWGSSDCSLPLCGSLNSCSNQGKCVLQNGQPTCQCNDGYHGSTCNDDDSTRQTVLIAIVIVTIVLAAIIGCGCLYLCWRRRGGRSHHSVFFDPISSRSARVFNKS